MPYVPPSGKQASLDLGLYYAPPPGYAVQLSIGTTASADTQYITTAGVPPYDVIGIYAITHRNQVVSAAGASYAAVSQVHVRNWWTIAQTAGNTPLAFGAPSVINRNRTITPSGSSYGVIQKVAQVQWAVRYLGAVGGSFLGFGKPRLELKNRYASVNGSSFAAFGAPTAGYYIRTRSVTGINAAFVGAATNIEYRNKIVAPNTVTPIGLPFYLMVSLKIRDALIAGEDSASFGDQVVTNRNRTCVVLGSSFALIGDHRVSAPPIVDDAGGFDSATFGGQFVSHFIRYVDPLSLGDTSAVCAYTVGQFALRWSIRRNGKATIHMLSDADRDLFGYPCVANTQHVIRQLNCCSGVGKPGRPTVSAL